MATPSLGSVPLSLATHLLAHVLTLRCRVLKQPLLLFVYIKHSLRGKYYKYNQRKSELSTI